MTTFTLYSSNGCFRIGVDDIYRLKQRQIRALTLPDERRTKKGNRPVSRSATAPFITNKARHSVYCQGNLKYHACHLDPLDRGSRQIPAHIP